MELQSDDIARVLVLVQTEPTISRKYTETVCTAGLRDMGDSHYQWIRLYPIVKRGMDEEHHYSKYQWIQCRLREPDKSSDGRPESFKVHMSTIEPQENVGTGTNRDWAERRKIILDSGVPCLTNKKEILEKAAKNEISLCFFKPSNIAKFYEEPQEPFNDEEKAIIAQAQKVDDEQLFKPIINFKGVPFERLPYRFRCKFYDDEGAKMDMLVLDWEISSLFRGEIKRKNNGIGEALRSTLNMYSNFIVNNDVYFILGTRLKDHRIMRKHPDKNLNPWSIISVIPFPKNKQKLLL